MGGVGLFELLILAAVPLGLIFLGVVVFLVVRGGGKK